MVTVDILKDEELQGIVDKFISSMLPHEKFEGELFTDILINFTHILKPEDLSMEYFVLFSVFRDLNKIKTSYSSYTPVLTQEHLESILTSNIMNLVQKPEVKITEWLFAEGHPNNIAIDTTLTLAVQKLYQRVVELYTRCFELEQASNEILTLLPALKSAFVNHVAETAINNQALIINGSLKIGRKTYAGSLAWLDYIGMIQGEITARLEDTDQESVHVDSLESTEKLLNGLANLYLPIATYGIDPLDEGTPILRHRLVVLAANENVGKTSTAIHIANRVIKNGGRVLYMCGESAKELIYAKLLSNYIYQKEGVYITEQHIAKRNECPEDIVKLINICATELYEQKSLILEPSFSYKTLYDELVAIYEKTKFDAVFIDHSLALKGDGKEGEKISDLAVQCREFKKRHPVYVCVNSHLSVLAKEAVIKGKEVTSAPTRGNGVLSAEADDVLILTRNEVLDKQNLLALQNYKRRNADRLTGLIFLKKKFNVSAIEYDPKYQNGYSDVNLTAEVALKNIADTYEDTDNEDDLYLD